MRIVRIFHVACVGVGVAMVSAHPADAQTTRDVVLHIHRAGDTVSVRNAAIVIDHYYNAGKTDSAGKLRVPDLEDGGHVIEATADGYSFLTDEFNSGPNIRQPIEVEMYPIAQKPDNGNAGASTVSRRGGELLVASLAAVQIYEQPVLVRADLRDALMR